MSPSPVPSQDQIDAVMADPAASFWLKSALRSSVARDPMDAALDATKLADLLCARCQEALRDAIAQGLVVPKQTN